MLPAGKISSYMDSSKLSNLNNRRKVTFAPLTHVSVFQPIVDKREKEKMYYSENDLYIFRKRYEIEIKLCRHAERIAIIQELLKHEQDMLQLGKHHICGLGDEILVSNKRQRICPL
jgi:hypothetical protein